MRILFLNYEYPPLGGGAGNATEYLLREFALMPDIQVDLVTSSPDSERRELWLGESVCIHALPIGKNGGNLHHQSVKDLLTYSWVAYRYAHKLLHQKEYDVIHAFFSVPCGAIAMKLGRDHKVPYIVSLRGSDVPGYSERFSFLYIFLKPIIRAIWKRAAAVVSNSIGLKELAQETSPKLAIPIIPNGVDTERFYPAPEKRPSDRLVITPGASRITGRKGLRYLVEALGLLKDEFPQLTLSIMGDGNQRAALEELAKEKGLAERVTFLGRIPKDETFQHYQEASIFVLPSLNEGMSNALLEALASGLPILATVTGGTHELVEEGENGFFIEMRSAEDIAEKLRKLVADPELRQRMGAESRRRAESMSWERVAASYASLYAETKQGR